MRKVTFYIDDSAFFNHEAPRVDLGDQESFKAIYTLYGEGKNIDRYELTDKFGNKIPLSSLNGYQRGVILNDCKAYFSGGNYHGNGTKPCGVVKIVDNDMIMEMIGEQKQYLAPTARLREDIANAMRVANNFEEYKTVMENNGYLLNEGNSEQHGRYITYTTSTGKKVRDYTLGENSTYERLMTFLKSKDNPMQQNNCLVDLLAAAEAKRSVGRDIACDDSIDKGRNLNVDR